MALQKQRSPPTNLTYLEHRDAQAPRSHQAQAACARVAQCSTARKMSNYSQPSINLHRRKGT
jgi:hypothetical protein